MEQSGEMVTRSGCPLNGAPVPYLSAFPPDPASMMCREAGNPGGGVEAGLGKRAKLVIIVPRRLFT